MRVSVVVVLALLAGACVTPYERDQIEDLEAALAQSDARIDELEDVISGLVVRVAAAEAAAAGEGARVDDLNGRVDDLEAAVADVEGADGLACWDLDGDGVPEIPDEDTNEDTVVDVNDCRGSDGDPGVSCWDLNADGAGDPSLEDLNGSGTVDVDDCAGGAGAPGADGLACWDFDADGIGDDFEDLNEDGQHDVRDCQGSEGPPGPDGTPCWDLDGDGQGDVDEDVDENGSYDAADCRPADGGGGGIVIDGATYTSVEPSPGDRVQVQEVILLAGGFDGLDVGALELHGGGFTGTTSSAVVELGRRSIVHGMRFENVRLDGFGVTFVDCDFFGAIELPADARVQASRFSGVVMSSNTYFDVIENSELDDSTIPRGRRFVGNLVDTSTIGDAVWFLTGNVFDDSTVFVAREGSVTGNVFDRSLLESPSVASGLIEITSNKFDGPLSGETTALRLRVPETAFIAVNVAGNNFTVQNGTPSSVEVLGTTSGGFQYQVVNLVGNTFLKGDVALSYGSTIRTVVRENVTRQTEIGPLSSGNLFVAENTEL